MEMEELFNSLESDNLQVVEDVKKQFADCFNRTKDAWLVTFLIDYYLQTNSVRVVDVLLKVQSPHDKFIFDRILDLIKSSNKQKGLDILGIIVRRQPTWLYHIMQHNLFKETLKLLKVETDIVPFMSALLCIIALLPMVPSLISPFLMDIFEVFSRLAAWKGNNTTKLPEDQLIHLQVGLYALFHRLYGMFPCNFVSYLKNKYSNRDQSVIFGHTIKPLLETVKMHPLLITTSKERETDNSRWKNMEVHDVVVECSRVMLENIERPDNQEYIGSNSKHIDCSSINFENSNLSRSHIITSQDFHASKMVDHISENKEFWSPSFACPPTTPPQTPTPIPNTHSYTPNITPSLMASNINTNLLKNDGQEGASPPEAAIEATPESTPLRDMRIRPIPPSSTVARALNTKLLTSSVNANQSLNLSQPSSPMRKDPSLFRYPDPADIETSSTSFQKLTRVISDRSQSQLENNASLFRYTNPTSPLRVSSHSDAFHNNITTSDAAQNTGSEFSVDNLDSSNMPEKDTINNSGENDLTEENVNQEDQFVDCIPASCTTCTSGGLHVPNSRSMKNFAEHIKRLRFYSQCNNDNISGGYYKGFSAGSSPADSSVILPKSKRLRRTASCPNFVRKTATYLDIIKVPKIEEVVDAPEEKEVKKEESQKTIVARSVQNNSTQTVPFWPQPFELLYIGLFPFGDNCSSKRNSAKDTIKQSPTDLLDQYIQCCINRQKSHGSDDRYNENAEIRSLREQLQLLHIELQFERHRREIHADRNRRLLGKCRDNRALEESNAALKERLQLFENDIQKLNQELDKKRAIFTNQEREWKAINHNWREKYNTLMEENAMMRAASDALKQQLAQQADELSKTTSELQEARAMLFDQTQEIREARHQAEIGAKYRNQLHQMHSELLLMGELQSRYKDKLAELPWLRARDEELEILHATYRDEIMSMQQTLEMKSNALEATRLRVTELENTLAKRDSNFSEQKRLLKIVKEKYQVQLDAVESKYAAQKSINQRMEEQLLELYRSENSAPISPDGSCKGAGDRSGPTVGSWDLWPGSSSPLSASLASSEGMMSSATTASGLAGRAEDIKNLQVIVDQPEQLMGSELIEQNLLPNENRDID